MDRTPSAARGRSRGRTRTVEKKEEEKGPEASPPQQAPVVQSEEVYQHMFGEEVPKKRQSDESSSSSNGNGNGNGNGSGSNGNGSNGGNGNGEGSNGDSGSSRGRGSPRGDSRGGSPRGMSPRMSAGTPEMEQHETALDYVVSRPNLDFVKRVQPTAANAVTVATNYYLFRTHPAWELSLYTVKIEPAVEDERKIWKLVGQKRADIGNYLLTGFQLFTTRPIKPDFCVFEVQLENDPIKYTIELTYKRRVAESEYLVIQFYNTVVRRIQAMMDYQLIGRHYFEPRQAKEFPTFRLKLWPGFQNSIRQQDGGLMMNVESVWKVLQTDSVRIIIENIKRQFSDKEQGKKAINAALAGTMVVTTYGKKSKVYKIDHVDFNANPTHTFPTKYDGNVSYMDYYKNRYDITIADKNQFMLVSLPKERDRRRGEVGDIFLVPELCYPCGLNDTLRSNFKLMKEIAVCLHMSATERVGTMNKFVSGAVANADITKTLKEWGIKLPDPRPVEVTGRMLKPEDIIMASGQTIRPDDKADWTMGLRGKRMFTSMSLKKWALVITNRDSANVGQLISTMQKVATPLGYNIAQPTIVKVSDARALAQGVSDAMGQAKGQLEFIMIILANNNADIYAAVKKRCSIQYGVPSQCFLAKNIGSKGLMSIATKVVIQMNAKQGGLPWAVSNPIKNRLMVLGYDVHHAGPGGGDSVGAMTATMDETLGSYYSCISQSIKRSEVGTTVESLFNECLKAYFKKNGALPEKIIMYRDGVGEGQLTHVFHIEIKAFKDRIASVYAQRKVELPKLTFVVVNKRICTRFFQQVGRNYDNPKPGFIVDDVITRPERYDFYLVSQTARQGCVSPTYYNVLLDEMILGPDKLQRFTYKMCHLYYNWSGTVAVPATCQNAHKLAFLVGTALKQPALATLAYQLHYL